MTGGGFVTGMLAGLAVGAALGVLYAPRPGAQIRAQVGDWWTRRARAAELRAKGTALEQMGELMQEAGRAEQELGRQQAAG